MNIQQIWFDPPDRLRVQINIDDRLIRTGVRAGTRWWRWDPGGDLLTGDLADPAGAPLPPLLDPVLLSPARVMFGARLEVVGRGERAGREVIRAHVWPIGSGDRTGTWHELEIDAIEGTLLSLERFHGHERQSHLEVLSISYDGTLDQALFKPAAEGHLEVDPNPARLQQPAGLEDGQTKASGLPPTIWLTGLPGAGKTTLAHAAKRIFDECGIPACVLDGDEIRSGLSSDLAMDRQGRAEQVRRVAHVATIIADNGVVPIVALVSPFARDRDHARQVHTDRGLRFIEVWVDTPEAVCAQRDPKGLYARARAGELQDLTGFNAPYEPPLSPELRVASYDESARAVAVDLIGQTEILRLFGL